MKQEIDICWPHFRIIERQHKKNKHYQASILRQLNRSNKHEKVAIFPQFDFFREIKQNVILFSGRMCFEIPSTLFKEIQIKFNDISHIPTLCRM